MLLSVPLAASHAHLSAGAITVIVIAAVSAWVIIATALPTRECPRCHGGRIQFTRHWLTGKARARPCRRCSGTGRVPRLGARTIHRLIWSATREKGASHVGPDRPEVARKARDHHRTTGGGARDV
jgi:hypothetical protein